MKSCLSSRRRSRPLLGTLVEVAVYGEERLLDTALVRAFEAISAVHTPMSFHEPASDVARLNREAWKTPLRVDARTWRVLEVAQSVSAASDGLFDVTVAPLLQQWGYLPALEGLPPADSQASWRDLELLEDCRVRFTRSLAIDLGGIAKGFAVDEAIAALRAAGAAAGCVNAGGDLRVFGDRAERIHIRHPSRAGHWIDAGMLRDAALATSSDRDSTRRRGGIAVSPLVNPLTGSRSGALDSVSVRAPDCVIADALTKVVMADPLRARPVLQAFAAEALVVSGARVMATRRRLFEQVEYAL